MNQKFKSKSKRNRKNEKSKNQKKESTKWAGHCVVDCALARSERKASFVGWCHSEERARLSPPKWASFHHFQSAEQSTTRTTPSQARPPATTRPGGRRHPLATTTHAYTGNHH
jgi:hypothetical protein